MFRSFDSELGEWKRKRKRAGITLESPLPLKRGVLCSVNVNVKEEELQLLKEKEEELPFTEEEDECF